ncbi:hypothetical protein ACXYN8_01000 [Altererythrobacter sp. CAU 1778]
MAFQQFLESLVLALSHGTTNVGAMQTKEQTRDQGVAGGNVLVEGLVHELISGGRLRLVDADKIISSSIVKGKGRSPAKRGTPTKTADHATTVIVRKAISALEHRHPGRKVVFIDENVLELASQVREHLPKVRDEQSKDYIERLLNVLTEANDPLAAPRRKIDQANAELRLRFFEEFDTYKATEIHDLSKRKTTNPHSLAQRWKKAGKIFAVDFKGMQRFPAFQFEHGEPRKVVGEVLEIFDGALGPWETAFWFVSSNKWLDGKAPVDMLDNADALVTAAKSTVGEHFG